MLFLLQRYFRERRALKRMMWDYRPRTGRAVAIMVACFVAVWLLSLGVKSLFRW